MQEPKKDAFANAFHCIEDVNIKSMSAFGDHRRQDNGGEANSTICVGLLKWQFPHKQPKHRYLPQLVVDMATAESGSGSTPGDQFDQFHKKTVVSAITTQK